MNSVNSNEYVLVFPSSILSDLGYFQGLCFDFNKYLSAIYHKSQFMKRVDAEYDYNYKQLIPYVIISCENKILSYRRGLELSEKRLSHKYSIGIGGHITINDSKSSEDCLKECIKREIDEEIYLSTEYNYNIVAVINDDSNEVGKVHFGVVVLMKLKKPLVKKKERAIIDCRFLEIKNFESDLNMYEQWSQICIRNIDKLLLGSCS